ncbi:Rgp1-domain-containing protein [Rhizophagus irregularis]|uniref:Rgp1-domain-containing protein n=1 Tax=Rhizophagus irregularis TaxID=588596 RepID=A0A2I1FUM3_9GLOM|nr:Rgp1-domain-containing protein [Rhizophagus irregularis]
MSAVIVTAKIPQNAVFFAGEKFRCEITFSCQPSNVDNLSSEDKSQVTSTKNGYLNHVRTVSESKSHGKKPSIKHIPNGNPLSAIVENPSIHNSLAGDLGDSGMFGFRNLVKRSASLTSIASSTFSLLAGSSGDSQPSSIPQSTVQNSSSQSHPGHTEEHDLEHVEKIDDKSTLTSEPVHITDEETDDDGGLIDLQQAGVNDNISISDLDTSESTTPRSSVDFYGIGHSERGSNTWSEPLTDYKKHSSSRRSSSATRCSSSPSLSQKYETLLWGFVQIVGHFIIDNSLVKSIEFEPLKTKTMYRPASGTGAGGAVGGGTLGIFSASTLSHSSLADLQERADSKSIPVFSTPPSILFCDLHLAPGELRTYTYETRLPNDLPPSHRGKAIRFLYYLIIGTHRGGMNHQSNVVQMPFRVFNYVSDDGSRPIYDLMNPVVIYKDEAIITCKEEAPKPKPTKKRDNKKEEFLDYLEKLVQSSEYEISSITDENDDGKDSDTYVFVEKEENSVANTATILSKNMRKANFDICKNNQRVAQLCLLKTSYRLGDIVTGTINFNDAVIPSYQVSITLESSEIVEPSIANRPQQQIARVTRKIHGEHHEFCLNAGRIGFAISIPTSGTPDFQTTGVKLQWCLRLEFITGPKGQSPLMPLNADERHQYYQAIDNINVETFDCSVPIKVYPTSYTSARIFPSNHVFRVT